MSESKNRRKQKQEKTIKSENKKSKYENDCIKGWTEGN